MTDKKILYKYEGYQHTDGRIILKQFSDFFGSLIDTTSPQVVKYGLVEAESPDEAKELLREQFATQIEVIANDLPFID
jgi:hypothetical protein